METDNLIEKRKRLHLKLKNDLGFFSEKCLKIRTKEGKVEPFVFNKAQRYLHQALEDQLNKQGRVRAIIIKGRQQGCSTYVAARFYHKAIWNPYTSVYILSHEASSSANLKQMVNTYHENSPELVRPKMVTDNFKMHEYENHSSYRVGTAGAGTTGRGQTHQLFHGSEVAYYQDTDGIETGVLQTVSDSPNTEIILESTANGMGNFFHRKTIQSLDPMSDWQVVFIPWYWQEEYQKAPHPDWQPTDAELQLQTAYKLTDAQLFWRYQKILEFGGNEWKFKQEYPFTIDEAFQTTGERLINPQKFHEAQQNEVSDPNAAVIMGVDAARSGDRTVFIIRQGRKILSVFKYSDMDEMRLCGLIIEKIRTYNIDKVFVDRAYADGAIDRLRELGYNRVVQGVAFSESPVDKERFLNKRAEMASDFSDWINQGGVSVPNDPDFAADVLSIPAFLQTSTGKLKLEDKEKIKKDLGRSPDIFDAAILSFAYPVRSKAVSTMAEGQYRNQQARRNQTELTTTKTLLRAILSGRG